MKKILLLLPLMILSCKKETKASKTAVQDSASTETALETEPKKTDSVKFKDSIVNNAPATKEVLRTGVMREVQNNKIIREADAEQLPFNLGEEFKEEGQQLVLKLKNVHSGTLKISLKPKNADMNIRISQVKNTDGSLVGPFGREAEVISNKNGEVWLTISRSAMASGNSVGSFSVSLE